jgi:ketosteroid isomerase-like protein
MTITILLNMPERKMRKLTVSDRLILALVILSSVMSVKATDIQVLSPDSSEYKQMLQITRNYYTDWSYKKGDKVFDEAGRYFSKNPDSINWDPLPPLEGHRSWEVYKDVIPKVWIPAGIVSAGILIANDGSFKAWRHEEVIWTTMNCLVYAQHENAPSATHACRGIQVWVLEDGKWLISHEHFSSPAHMGGNLFQAVRKEDPRIKPNTKFLQRAQTVAEQWQNGLITDADKRLGKYYETRKGLFHVYMPWQPLAGYRSWSALGFGLREFVSLPIKKMEFTYNKDFEATQRGDLAWSTATLHYEFKMQDETNNPADGRQTIIWHRKGKDWLIVHEHLSIPMGE